MSLRYTLEETRVLFAEEGDDAEVEILPSTARPWRKWIAVASAVALTGGAMVAAYMGVGPFQKQLFRDSVNFSASAHSTAIPFGAVDRDADGNIDREEITAMLHEHASRLSDEINNDESLGPKLRAIKLELLTNELDAKLTCWTAKMDSFEQATGPVTEASFPLYLELVESECPRLTIENRDEVTQSAITGVTAPQLQSGEIDAFFSSHPVEDPIVSFLMVDSNTDGEIDESEVTTYLIGHLHELVKEIEADESLDPELKATHLQLLNDEIAQQKDCIHRVMGKLEHDGVKLSPATFQVFEMALNDMCPVGGVAGGAN
ncbi:hypothetical protein ATCC90586_000840 [Pythium insidiosum]|nr:hypothetical protein ATCC90586_000840 [Pythium insidiosum]